jgi:hypothetical protein
MGERMTRIWADKNRFLFRLRRIRTSRRRVKVRSYPLNPLNPFSNQSRSTPKALKREARKILGITFHDQSFLIPATTFSSS